MAEPLEIVITSKNQSGAGFAAVQRDAAALKADLKAVQAASKIDAKVNVDGTEIKRAEGDLRGLDAIPDPTVDIDVDTSKVDGAADEISDKLSNIDIKDIGSSIAGQMSQALSMAGPVGAVVGLAAAAIGDDFAAGISRGFSGRSNRLAMEIETGFEGIELDRIGREAGDAYADGFGESLKQLTVAAATLETSLRDVDASFDLEQATKAATVLEEHLGVGIPESAVLAARMIRQGLANDTVEAFDIMTYATQQYGQVGIEALELTKEFGTVFGQLGLDGAASVDFVARSFAEGLLPTIDRGAELLEEFQIRITDLDSQDAIRELGLDFEEMHRLLATGQGDVALQRITQALLDMEDKSRQATLANIIFGAAMESAFDRPEMISRLNELANATLDVAGASQEATDKAEAMVSQWDLMSRRAEDFGAAMGTVVATKVNEATSGLETLGGVLEWVARDLGLAEEPVTRLGTAMEKGGSGGRDFADALDGAADSVDSLDAALERLTGQYDTDQMMRRFQEDVEAATTAAEGLTAEAYNLGEGFDITTESGRNAEAAFEDVGRSLIDLAEAHREGSVTTAELADKQREARETLQAVAAQMGLTRAETQELIDKYGSVPGMTETLAIYETNKALQDRGQFVEALNGVPPDTNTTAHFNAWTAIQNVNSYVAKLLGIPSSRSTTVYQNTVVTSSVRQLERAVGGVIGAAAGGGVRNGATLVGEFGPELVNLPSGSMVRTAGDTARDLAQSRGGGGPVVNVTVMGSVLSQRDLAEVIRDQIYQGDYRFGSN